MNPDAELEYCANTLRDAAKFAPEALRRVSDASPGFPGGHTGTGDTSTQPERFEKTMADRSIRDLAEYRAAKKRLRADTATVWGFVTKWGTRRDTADLQVADPTDEMWCRSCLTINHLSPRRLQGGVDCDWCATTLRELNRWRTEQGRKALTALPVPALQAHAQGKRVYRQDLERWAGVKELREERANSRKTRVLASPDPNPAFSVAVFCSLCGSLLGRAEGASDTEINAATRQLQQAHSLAEHAAG